MPFARIDTHADTHRLLDRLTLIAIIGLALYGIGTFAATFDGMWSFAIGVGCGLALRWWR